MDEQRLQELNLALHNLSGNAFWQWLCATVGERRLYLQQRLRAAADWPEHCFVNGQLDAVDQLTRQVREIADFGRQPPAKGGDQDEFHANVRGL